MTQSATMLQAKNIPTTPIRLALLDVLRADRSPKSADQLVALLRPQHPTLNRTTIYRELARFAAEDLVEEVLLASRARVYELVAGHHHHAICTNCDTVAHVDIPESLGHAEQLLQAEHGFMVRRHSLEFYGLCAPCSKAAV